MKQNVEVPKNCHILKEVHILRTPSFLRLFKKSPAERPKSFKPVWMRHERWLFEHLEDLFQKWVLGATGCLFCFGVRS